MIKGVNTSSKFRVLLCSEPYYEREKALYEIAKVKTSIRRL